jgi:hypothetical protein
VLSVPDAGNARVAAVGCGRRSPWCLYALHLIYCQKARELLDPLSRVVQKIPFALSLYSSKYLGFDSHKSVASL